MVKTSNNQKLAGTDDSGDEERNVFYMAKQMPLVTNILCYYTVVIFI